jgi:hypothetical protein
MSACAVNAKRLIPSAESEARPVMQAELMLGNLKKYFKDIGNLLVI